MSFITKRERVFNDYDLFDLPSRNEGKLKAYASCTDARAWSHFCSDKTEHLVEIIKRNNEKCRTKYVPTDVIVDTLMVAKNAEIGRLRRKIEEFEQLLAAYDQLDLTCDQKCEIAIAHAAIKAANKELDELCLDLDLSGFTEGIDSDAFETGNSRGDEVTRYKGEETMVSKGSESAKSRGDEWDFTKEVTKMESKCNQAALSRVESTCRCDVSTSAHDTRIEELQDAIISKDAKLSAMQNTIAVMENDVCEPYCIYAHIYTALEKIFGVLCQNDKYKLYLSLMTAGKDTRCIDIKGKILFKLKVLEKFSLALIAPCSQEMRETPKDLRYSSQDMRDSSQDCACFRAEVVARLDFPSVTAEDSTKPIIDNKRAHLVADIMENEEMKELLNKDSISEKREDDQTEDGYAFDTYSIDTENLKRLKNLQENYNDLMICHEKVKFEKDSLQVRCHKYEELEREFNNLKDQLREYNVLWSEREHYRKRSLDIDSLKEQYMVLADETSNLETQLKAEAEINHMKTITIDELRNENILLEQKLNEALISFEKEKNALQCKLKETECTVMCQDQQIKSLSIQIDRLLEQTQNKMENQEDSSNPLILYDEIESLKEQIKNLKDALYCSEEEKQHLQEEFEDKLKVINDLKMEIEDWKSTYEKTAQRNEYLEKYTDNFRDEVHILIGENRTLSQDVEEKTIAVENLINVINNKSQEVKQLTEEIEQKDNEQKMLYNQVQELREMYHDNISAAEDEKKRVLQSLQLARQESQELIEKVKDYNNVVHENDSISKSLETKSKGYDEAKKMLEDTMEQNKNLQMDLKSKENNNSILLQEIQRLREVNSYALSNISDLQGQKNEYKTSLELTKKESQTLENKLIQFENLTQEMDALRTAYTNLTKEKNKLEEALNQKKYELENSTKLLESCKKESNELVGKLSETQIWKDELANLNKANNELLNEKRSLQAELTVKNNNFESLLKSLNEKNDFLVKASENIAALQNELIDLKKSYDDLLLEKNILQNDFHNKTEDLNNLYNNLESKIEENRELLDKINELDHKQRTTNDNIIALQNESLITQSTLTAIQKESAALIDKLKHYETLESEYEQLKRENECIQDELSHQIVLLKDLQRENQELTSQNHNLQELNENLEQSLIDSRSQLLPKSGNSTITYDDILKEVEDMKKDKIRSHNKIKDLLNKLDESDNINLNLSEEIIKRDDKIATLENLINHLEDEIRRLHNNLEDLINTGESMKDNNLQMDRSLKTIEAHHSKAAHNMKVELAKLQNENSKLEEQLSVTKIKTEESSRDKNKYLSQVIHLQNERELIASDIKQLEIKSVGDSSLTPEQCRGEDVQASIDRIRKSIDAKYSKSSCLEQTILKVQTSSQLLLTKADEAKKLVEKEKQKIITEKEDAIRDRLHMETRLDELKTTLEAQISNDAKIVKDLEANMLNQKLMNEHTISKLKEELQAMQSSYQNSAIELNALQEKIHNLTKENENYLKMNEQLNEDLDKEIEEKKNLQNKLEEFCNKSVHSVGIQVHLLSNIKHKAVETEKQLNYEYENIVPFLESDIADINKNEKNIKDVESLSHANLMHASNPTENKLVSSLLPKQKPHSVNEVQVLTANVEPSFDFVRSSYLNYKIQCLSQGRLEQYSISNLDLSENSMPETTALILNDGLVENDAVDPNLVDIYGMPRISSKTKENATINISKHDAKAPSKSSGIADIDYTENKKGDTNDSKEYTHKKTSSTPGSMDADLFVIYKDSESNCEDDVTDRKIPVTTIEQAEMFAESVSGLESLREVKNKNIQPQQNIGTKVYLLGHDLYPKEDKNEVDEKKPKLNIKLPKVEKECPSVVVTSEGDKKSLDSYTLGIYASPKQNSFTDINIDSGLDLSGLKQETLSLPTISNEENQHIGSYSGSDEDIHFIRKQEMKRGIKKLPEQSEIRLKTALQILDVAQNISSNLDEISHHKLSRVGADVYLISKDNTEHTNSDEENTAIMNKPGKFALDYILDSIQYEINHDSPKSYSPIRDLRKIKSDEQFDLAKTMINYGPSKRSPIKVSSMEYKTISSPSQSYSKTSHKTLVDQSIMAKIDITDSDYESKIKNLTKALENTEKDCKKKLDAIKIQYDMNIKNILTEHNLGVKNIQGLHEETLQDVIKVHENEIENLRTISIEANRKAEKLEKENRSLRSKIQDQPFSTGIEEEPTKIASETKKRRQSRLDTKILTKTNVEAFNSRPSVRSHGPCTCTLDANISDPIRNIFEQVDVEQRKMAEHTYVKYIANKIVNNNVEALDAQELSFLHLKVCRTWKSKMTKEEALQKRIDSLESELIHKQRHAQQHTELDRKVAEERRRLQEVREAVCRSSPVMSRNPSPLADAHVPPAPLPTAMLVEHACACNTLTCSRPLELRERRSAGDLAGGSTGLKQKRVRAETNRAVLAKLEMTEKRAKKLYNDEPPTRLRRSHDRAAFRHKK